MNSRIFLYFLLFLILSISTACSKKVSGTKETKDLKDFKVSTLGFEYLSTKSKIKFKDKDNDISLNATIRIKKDSIIWLSLSPAFGIEAARGLVTQDSLVLMNRINREYVVFNYKSLSEKLNFDVTFELIQALLLGEMPLKQSLRDRVIANKNHFIIQQQVENLKVDNFITISNLKPERIQLLQDPSQNSITLLYSNFQSLGDDVIPFDNKFVLNYLDKNNKRQSTLIDINHGKAEIADASLEFPFNIPKKYDRQ